jgi:hypothetical protein
MDTTTALQVIKTTFSGLKTVADLIKDNKQSEAAVAVADIQIKLGDLSTQFMEMSATNLTLSKENTALKEKLEFKETLNFKKPYYVTKSGDGPFCPTCWDDDRKAMRLDGPDGGARRWVCKKCKNYFDENPNYVPPPINGPAWGTY